MSITVWNTTTGKFETRGSTTPAYTGTGWRPSWSTGPTFGDRIMQGLEDIGGWFTQANNGPPSIVTSKYRDKYTLYNPPPTTIPAARPTQPVQTPPGPPVVVPPPGGPMVNLPTKEVVGAIAGGMTSIGNAVASFFGSGWGYAASAGRELVEGRMYGDKIKLGAYWISMAVLAGIAIKLGGPRIGRMLNRYLSTPYNQRGTLRQTHEWLMAWARRNRGRIVSTLRSAHSAYRFSDTYATYKARYGEGVKTKYVYTAPMRGYYTGGRGYGRRRRKRGFKRRYGY